MSENDLKFKKNRLIPIYYQDILGKLNILAVLVTKFLIKTWDQAKWIDNVIYLFSVFVYSCSNTQVLTHAIGTRNIKKLLIIFFRSIIPLLNATK